MPSPPPEQPAGDLLPRPRPAPPPGWDRIDAWLYPAFAGACVLYAALVFYGSMRRQTGGEWSAPLDDVFIHFDYARATARGYPFQWSEGNGFSSGNTSLTYPFVLALGYWAGFRDQADERSLMIWAALVGCVSTFAFLLGAARLVTGPGDGARHGLGRWAKYLVPPVLLSLGALDWSLFSGMENAFHLAVWSLMLLPVLALRDEAEGSPGASPSGARPDRIRRLGWLAGAAGGLLYATRPESVVCIAAFGVFAAVAARRALGFRAAGATLLRIGSPGAVGLVLQSLANRAFTGEWSANGAIVKLALNNPYMPADAKWNEYLFHLEYVFRRNLEHHFAELHIDQGETWGWGWLVAVVAAIPLLSGRTRAVALLLWAQVLGWAAIIALNGQVRWQNERYTMAGVAWLYLLAALGLGVLLSRLALPGFILRRERLTWLLQAPRVAAAIWIVHAYWDHQLPQMRDQIWFFGRACRNIRDQHLVAGRVLGRVGAKRVLVGDAGALMYASDRPGLDIIGLGGYHDFPFARAGVHGLGASLELIERMPDQDRPDMMAIYPSWWGDLPTLFGHYLTGVTVHGNVICGGAEKAIYRADWHALDRRSGPRDLRPGEVVVDELDVADLISEREHRYTFPHPGMGFVDFHVLPDPEDARRDLFDAGRVIPTGQRETARVRVPRGKGRLVARTTLGERTVVEVAANGAPIGRLALDPGHGWVEGSMDLPAGLPAEVELSLTPVEGTWFDCHVWMIDAP